MGIKGWAGCLDAPGWGVEVISDAGKDGGGIEYRKSPFATRALPLFPAIHAGSSTSISSSALSNSLLIDGKATLAPAL